MYKVPTDVTKNCLKALGEFETRKKAEFSSKISAAFNIYSFCFNCSRINKNKNQVYELFEFNMVKNIKLITVTNFTVISNNLIEDRGDFEQIFSIFIDYISKDVDLMFLQSKDSRVIDTLLEEEFKDIKIREIPSIESDHRTFSFSGTKNLFK